MAYFLIKPINLWYLLIAPVISALNSEIKIEVGELLMIDKSYNHLKKITTNEVVVLLAYY